METSEFDPADGGGTAPAAVGDLVGPVEVGPVAHGGHCVARWHGRVVFVRHTLPGEEVTVRLTDTEHDRFWRGDAVRVHRPSADRVDAPCAIAGPGRCGGCDFQHVTPAAQRRLKADVVAEQVSRLGGLNWPVEVEQVPAPGVAEGLRWRRRMRYRTVGDGAGGVLPGLRAHRSHEVIPLPPEGCLIADQQLALDVGGWDEVAARAGPGRGAGIELLGAAAPQPSWYADGELIMGEELLVERAAGRSWRVAADGFWQVHPGAADALVSAVLSGLDPQPGERVFDLFCGVGLFAGALADRGCRVWGVEAERRAIESARANLADLPRGQARFTAGRVDRVLAQLPRRTDLVVLDPPRTGAGRRVINAVVERRPRAIALVACDPAALGRDLGLARRAGYRVADLRAFDLFPMTHHVECVAVLLPDPDGVSAGPARGTAK